ncbi:MAG: alkaline phosphatase family protein [Bacteroidetes bacterium]|nr:alkaline phosphatase family protein [Bacteroidota bacterium]
MKRILPVWIVMITALNVFSQTAPAQPKLVVGVVVDQMAYEFLYRYSEQYTENGFKRLLKEGYSCENTHYSYIPTYTGPGHASIYTGSVPAVNGIVSNDWYDEKTGQFIYVTQDNTVTPVGAVAGNQQSPRNLLTTTVTDMLQLSNQQESKVIGIALKDRGAILPAGHTADAAYWYDGAANAWVISSYYMPTLPPWVQNFNAQKPAEQMMNRYWNLLLPPTAYKSATADSVSWETVYIGEASPKFPHYMNFTGNSEAIKGTPFGNTLTANFAKAAIENEELGKDNVTDFLCVSFSSTDYVGHAYGPHSVEVMDTYLRLDRDLAELLTYLDTKVGKGNYVLFLTADHGVSPTPQYMESLNIPAGTTTEVIMTDTMNDILHAAFGPGEWIKAYTNQQIYLNDSLLLAKGKTKKEIFSALYEPLLKMNGVAYVILINELGQATLNSNIKELVINGIYPKRCGDIQILYEPYWFEAYRPTGTTHGSHFSYDTHVPLIFFGWKVKPGALYRDVQVTDIAPTISALLKISEPNGCVGTIIPEVVK